MKRSGIIFQQTNKAEKYNELLEFHSLIIVDVTSFKQLVNVFFCKWYFKFVEAVPQLLLVYRPIWILVFKQNLWKKQWESNYQQIVN